MFAALCEHERMRTNYVFLLAVGVLSFCFAACGGNKAGDDGTGDCLACELAGVRCFIGAGSQDICAADETLAAITCAEGGGSWEIPPLCPPETETGDGSNSDPWDPDGSVTFDRESGEYVIDVLAFEQIKRDPSRCSKIRASCVNSSPDTTRSLRLAISPVCSAGRQVMSCSRSMAIHSRVSIPSPRRTQNWPGTPCSSSRFDEDKTS